MVSVLTFSNKIESVLTKLLNQYNSTAHHSIALRNHGFLSPCIQEVNIFILSHHDKLLNNRITNIDRALQLYSYRSSLFSTQWAALSQLIATQRIFSQEHDQNDHQGMQHGRRCAAAQNVARHEVVRPCAHAPRCAPRFFNRCVAQSGSHRVRLHRQSGACGQVNVRVLAAARALALQAPQLLDLDLAKCLRAEADCAVLRRLHVGLR